MGELFLFCVYVSVFFPDFTINVTQTSDSLCLAENISKLSVPPKSY